MSLQKSRFFVFFVPKLANFVHNYMELQLANGLKLNYDSAQVMGIINVTPDSFFEGSRVDGEDNLRARVRQIVEEGGTMVDVGAYSTRPDADDVSVDEELSRLAFAIPVIVDELQKLNRRNPSAYIPVSVDTFRAEVAKTCVLKYGADIINDVSGGTLDEDMLLVVAETKVPYILMHMRGTPKNMQTMTEYPDGVTNEVVKFFRKQIERLQETALALNPEEEEISLPVILDPGFGFAKTIEQNYQLFSNLASLKASFKDYPLLVGISRKSMIYKLLETDANHALNGTMVLNALAVASGADILRVHDVKEAVAVVKQVSNK